MLACAATTHALVAPPRRQPAQTLRKVKIDTDNFFFKALDGAKELAFKAGDLVQDAGDLAKDARDRAQEASDRTKAKPAAAPTDKAAPPAKKAAPDFVQQGTSAEGRRAGRAGRQEEGAVRFRRPRERGASEEARRAAAAPGAKQAPFDFEAANEASKARVDAAFASLDAAADALKAGPQGAGDGRVLRRRAAGRRRRRRQGARPGQGGARRDDRRGRGHGRVDRGPPDNVKSTADSVGSAVTGTVDAVAAIPENVKNTADGVASTVKSTADAVASIPDTVKSTAEAVAAVPEKIGNAVDSAVATAEAVAAVPGKIADGVAGFRPRGSRASCRRARRSSGRRPSSSGRRSPPKEEVGPADGASKGGAGRATTDRPGHRRRGLRPLISVRGGLGAHGGEGARVVEKTGADVVPGRALGRRPFSFPLPGCVIVFVRYILAFCRRVARFVGWGAWSRRTAARVGGLSGCALRVSRWVRALK